MTGSLDQFDFHRRIAATGGVTLVTFGSADCGSCRHLERVLDEVRKHRPDWHFYRVDAQRDAALTHEFEVFHLPTLFLFSNGEFHCELHAEARPATVIAAAERALSLPAEEAP